MSEQFEAFKKAHPDLNWEEAEEIYPEDLAASADFFDDLLAKVEGALGMAPKYPKIKVKLSWNEGNAFAILGRVSKAMEEAGLPKEEISKFITEAMESDYNKLIQTCMRWVNVE
jgi:hypothetical protein